MLSFGFFPPFVRYRFLPLRFVRVVGTFLIFGYARVRSTDFDGIPLPYLFDLPPSEEQLEFMRQPFDSKRTKRVVVR